MFQQNQNQTRRSFFSAIAAAVAGVVGLAMGARPAGAGGGRRIYTGTSKYINPICAAEIAWLDSEAARQMRELRYHNALWQARLLLAQYPDNPDMPLIAKMFNVKQSDI